jgi:hypothetical protein
LTSAVDASDVPDPPSARTPDVSGLPRPPRVLSGVLFGREPGPQRVRALAVAAVALAAAACAHQSDTVEKQVRTGFDAFPVVAQSKDAHPWPMGRFTGGCRRSVLTFGGYACLYADTRGRRGFACFTTKPRLRLTKAIGPDERNKWTDHSGRILPPERVC